MSPLQINRALLKRAIEATPLPRRASSNGASSHGRSERGSRVSAEVIAETKARYPDCRCEEYGLEPNMLASDLIYLAEGCTEPGDGTGWVCERLNTIRRRYG